MPQIGFKFDSIMRKNGFCFMFAATMFKAESNRAIPGTKPGNRNETGQQSE